MTIFELRQSTGLSQQKFGDALGIPMRTVQDWERGVRTPVPYLVDLIAFRLSHDPDFPRKKEAEGK